MSGNLVKRNASIRKFEQNFLSSVEMIRSTKKLSFNIKYYTIIHVHIHVIYTVKNSLEQTGSPPGILFNR